MNNPKLINQLKNVAQQYGTPVYIYDLPTISEQYSKLQTAFTKYYPKTQIHFSVKSNSNYHVLNHLKKLGAGADCASPYELYVSGKAGFEKHLTLYTGNYESAEDLSYALENATYINLDDISSFDRLLEIKTPEIISFRINPGIGKGGFEGIVTGGADAKFGIPYEKAEYIYQKALNAGIKRFGVHIMTGSNNLEPYYFAEAVDKLMSIVGPIFNKLSIVPEYFDIGGGFGVPYTDEENELDIDLTAKLLVEVFVEKLEKYKLGEPMLFLEPGRYLTAQSGYLLTKVTGKKDSYKKFVGLDAGMSALLRPALYGAEHRIEFLGKEGNTHKVSICGQICENSDIFVKNVYIPDVDEGDLAVIRDVGAYGYAMSSNYNGRMKPCEVIFDGEEVFLSRKRDDFDRLFESFVL